MGENLKLTVSAGPTLFLISGDIYGNYGFAVGPTLIGQYYTMDWIDFDMHVEISEKVIGGNISIDFEYVFSEFLSFFIEGRYFISKTISNKWVIKSGRYPSENGYFYQELDEDFPIG